jgi:hypothetical protein
MVYVIKTIHGRRYRYWQESKRIDGKVKTTSVYIGRVDEQEDSRKQKPQKRKPPAVPSS